MRENSCYRINYAKKRLEVRQARKHEASFSFESCREKSSVYYGLEIVVFSLGIVKLQSTDSLPSKDEIFKDFLFSSVNVQVPNTLQFQSISMHSGKSSCKL